ncbi:MAG TPA: serine hydrolase domain-containing protein [Methylovirgula sp.]|nr:serine hydrolase domain-containing protein [Methylovirgula sp.]
MLLFALPSVAGAQSWSADKSQRIDQLVERFRQIKSDGATLPTLSIAIGVDGWLAMAKGYGASDGKPVTEHTEYEVGSLTKQFTAAAILEMIRAGATSVHAQAKLSVDTPLVDVFGKSSYWASQPWLTVGRLLTMTSNLPNFTRRPPEDANPWEPITADHLFEDIENSTPTVSSNEFDYCNTNYFLLAEMMEQIVVPGEANPESYHDFLRKHIFQPAGMLSTGFIGERPDDLDPPDPFAPPEARSQPISTAAVEQGAVLASPDYRLRRRPPFTNPDWLKGSGDMVSSALDLFAWHKALMSAQIVPPEVRDQMFSDTARVAPFIYYGMGWFCEHKDDRDIYSHSGAVPGYTSYNAIIRLKSGGKWISITLLSNSDQLDGLDDLADNMANVVLE